jgi:hypothetical protein
MKLEKVVNHGDTLVPAKNRFKNINHGDTATRREAKAKTGFWFFAVSAVSPWLKNRSLINSP